MYNVNHTCFSAIHKHTSRLFPTILVEIFQIRGHFFEFFLKAVILLTNDAVQIQVCRFLENFGTMEQHIAIITFFEIVSCNSGSGMVQYNIYNFQLR